MAENTTVKFTFVEVGLDRIQKALEQTKESLRILGIEEKDLERSFRGLDKAAGGSKTSLNDINRAAKGASGGVQELKTKQDNIITQRYALYDVASTYGAIATAIFAAGTAASVAFASQESAFTSVQRIAQGSSAQMSALRDELTALSTEIPVSFQDLSRISSLGAALDIPAASLASFTETVAKFSATTGVTAEVTATAFGKIATYLGLSQEEFDNLGSAVLRAGNISVATEEQVLKFSEALALPGAKANISAEQIVAMAGTLASFGNINVEGAGSAVSRVFEGINLAVAEGGDALTRYAATAGMSANQFATAWETDAGRAFNSILTGLSAVDNLDVALQGLGVTNEREGRILSALVTQLDSYMRIQGEVSSAWREGTYMSESYGLVLDDVASKFTILMNAFTNTAAALGAAFAPALNVVISLATDLLVGFQKIIDNPVGKWFIGFAAVLGTVIGAFMFYKTIQALATASTYALVTAQAALAGGAGGASTGFIGLIKTLLGYTSTVAVADTVTSSFTNGLKTDAAIGLASSVNGMTTSLGAYSAVAPIATGATKGLTTALKALGAATIIGAILQTIVTIVMDLGGTAVNVGNFINFLADTFYNLGGAAWGVLTIISPLLTALAGITTLLSGGKSPGDSLRGLATGMIDWGNSMNGADADATDLGYNLEDLTGYFDDATAGAYDAAGGMGAAGNAAKDAAIKVRTLVDYASDLASVFDRAFELRFSGESTFDNVYTKINAMRQANENARDSIIDINDSIRDLNATTQSLTADKSMKEYWLGIAEAYGDTLRANELRAEIADTDAKLAKNASDLAKKNKDLAKQNAILDKSMTGTSDAAIENRSNLRDLVSSYEDHINALASSGLSQDELRQRVAELKQEFIDQATQLGYNESEVTKYAKSFDDLTTIINNVPRNITVGFNVDPALQALAEFQAKLDEANRMASSIGSGGGGGGGIGIPKIPKVEKKKKEELPIEKPGSDWWNEMWAGWNGMWGDISTEWNNFWRDIGTTFAPLFNIISGIGLFFYKTVFEPIGSWINKNLVEPFNIGMQVIGEWINTYISEPFNKVFTAVGEWFNTYVVQPINAGFTAIGQWFNTYVVQPIQRGWQAVATWFNVSFIQPIQRGFNAFIQWFVQLWEAGKNGPRSVANYISGTVESIKSWFHGAISNIIGWFNNIPNSIRNGFNSVAGFIGGIMKDVLNSIIRQARSFSIGGFKPFGALPYVYAEGGFTGQGGKYEPAGIVHKGEYVVPKKYVNQSTGTPDMAYLNRISNAKAAPRTAGYANGGRVTGGGAIELGPATIHALSSALRVRVDVDGQAVAQAVSTQNQMANWAGVN